LGIESRSELDPYWAARPFELVEVHGQTALLIEDPGGEFLDRLLGAPMAVPEFLDLAVGIVKAVGHLHTRGFIHQDIKPANLLVNTATGEAWLAGFGLTSRLPRHRQSSEPREIIVGTQKELVPSRGLFASGKFDQFKRDIPYATLAQAFRSLVRQILTQSNAEVLRWRTALLEALGPNGQLIVNLVPEIEHIIGQQPPVADLPAQDAQNRFQMVFRRFLGVFAGPKRPLVLFLDDLQWLDPATLDLLEHLVTHAQVRHLLLVGAYRDNEVGPAHPLLQTLKAIREAEAKVHEIVLAPLGLDDIERLVAESLHCPPEHATPLAQLVQEKTSGNPFFAIQFLTALAEEKLLEFDQEKAAWSWEFAPIKAKRYTDNGMELVAEKLDRLPGRTQEALRQLACLGNVAQLGTVTWILGESEPAIHAALGKAVRAGLVFCLENAYTFCHDRVREAAYALIPETERAAVHLRIGRLLASLTPATELEEKIFEIVNQLNRGAALIAAPEERVRVAELNRITRFSLVRLGC
jgi:predicted ATPase